MLFTKVAFIYSFILFNKLCYGYDVPYPEIIAYKPHGLRVSIPHTPGIRLFAFHSNINKLLSTLQQGDYTKEIKHEANGRWGFYDPQITLHVGDVINYWTFILKDDLGYRQNIKQFEITELEENPALHNTAKANLVAYRGKPKETCSNVDNILCIQSIFNVSQSLIQLQTEFDKAYKKNQQLRNFIESMPDSKKLTLSGRIPPDGEAASTVSFILNEKVDIKPTIVSAKRNTDGSITFEVPSIDEKLEILELAKSKLVTTKILIQ